MADIMTYIAKGRENAIKRDELVRILNLPDRVVRKMIQDARDRGEIILNSQDGAGCYTSDDVGELERQYNTNRRRALSILRQQIHLARRITLLEDTGQITMDEVTGRG